MIKKTFKYLLRGLLYLLIVLIMVPTLLYIPFIQNFIRDKAESYVNTHTDMKLSIGYIRLAFPLNLAIDHVLVTQELSDTLLYCDQLRLRIALWPLLNQQVRIRNFSLDQTIANYTDTTSNLALQAKIGTLKLKTNGIDLKQHIADINTVELSDGSVHLAIGPSSDKSTDTTSSTPWIILADKLRLNNIHYSMETAPNPVYVDVQLLAGNIDNVAVDLGKQQVQVDAIQLQQGNYSYLTGHTIPNDSTQSQVASQSVFTHTTSSNNSSSNESIISSNDTTTRTPIDTISAPWTITVNHIDLQKNTITYGSKGTIPQSCFDPAYIVVSDLNLTADSLYNRGSTIQGQINLLSFVERSGIDVTELSGRFGMDSNTIYLQNFNLHTPESLIQLDLQAGATTLQMAPESPITLDLTAQISPNEILPWFNMNTPSLRQTFAGKTVLINSKISGTLGHLISETDLNIPHHLNLALKGQIGSITDVAKLRGHVDLRGALSNAAFLSKLFQPNTVDPQRLVIPKHIGIRGAIDLNRETYVPRIAIAVDSGTLKLNGRLNLKSQQYNLALSTDNFPVKDFLPHDSLGRLTMSLNAQGKRFDPFALQTASNVDLTIDRFDYLGYTYNNIGLQLSLQDHLLKGFIYSQNPALRLSLGLNGNLTEKQQTIAIQGKIDSCYLDRMHLITEPIGGTLALNLSASASADSSYSAILQIDNITLWNDWEKNSIRPVNLSFTTSPIHTRIGLKSGDLTLGFDSPSSVDSLSTRFSHGASLMAEMLRGNNFYMDSVSQQLPPFRLRAEAGDQNILNNFLKLQGIGFKNMDIDASLQDSLSFKFNMIVNQLNARNIQLDTLTLGLRQQQQQLNYLLRVANHPGNLDSLGMIALYGNIAGNEAILNCLQEGRAGNVGFRFGLRSRVADSTITISMFPEKPIFGSEPWQINQNNYIAYHFGHDLHADFRLTHNTQHVSLTTPNHTESGPLTLDIQGIDIGKTLALFLPSATVGGILSTKVTLHKQDFSGNSLDVNGLLNLVNLSYDGSRIGNLNVGFTYDMQQKTEQHFNTQIELDSTRILTAQGHIVDSIAETPFNVQIDLPGLPLKLANAFMPADMAQLDGILKGNLDFAGDKRHLLANGNMLFDNTSIKVGMIGTTFTLSPTPIQIENSTVRFNNFQLIAPNKQPLSINGNITLQNPSNITTDLTLTASDFQLVNVAKSRRTMVYGQAYMDLNTRVRGPIDNLFIRGAIGLLGGTDVSYIMQDAPLEVKQQNQNIVTFVSFKDTTSQTTTDTVRPMRVNGMDLLMNVNVNNQVKLGVDLSDDGENRVQLQGGGALTYTLNPLGDSRFSGKYIVSGGFVRYKPPVISEKKFDIVSGSYVEWTGNMLDPAFNLTAIDKIRTNVTTDGSGTGQAVTFNVSINIRNTLSDMAVTFDLSAPENLTMQNQLASLTAEQRSSQAMSLLIYNTYTGPGTTAKVNSSNPLNALIAKELNQWAQNSLKGVDLSFGINSYDATSTGGKQYTDYSYQMSKSLFNNRVRAIIGGKFSTDSDPTENLKENLIDDISLEYMLTKRDNIFIKLFRHTDYESILEGEVIETGVGFVIRKKLLKLSDLFRFMKNKADNQQQSDSNAVNETATKPEEQTSTEKDSKSNRNKKQPAQTSTTKPSDTEMQQTVKLDDKTAVNQSTEPSRP